VVLLTEVMDKVLIAVRLLASQVKVAVKCSYVESLSLHHQRQGHGICSTAKSNEVEFFRGEVS
jgi:hypothetical protein